jgi:hypothetical protein
LIMNVLIDLLGAVMIATLLLLMIITFQLQLRDTADRTIFAAQMMRHEQNACRELNNLIALTGVNLPIDSVAVVLADSTRMAFRTYWDFSHNMMTGAANTISFTLNPNLTDFGRQLDIMQSASPVYDLGSILWLEDMHFQYYDINGNSLGNQVTANSDKLNIFSVDVNMTFKRNPPRMKSTPLRTKVQLRCYMMNRYLRYVE